jgi:two-component system chemotaxis response regulator CheY
MRALIVDNNEFARVRLREALEGIGIEVAGEAGDGFSAVEEYCSLKPDIVAMAITMPEIDGIEATKMIRTEDPEAKILMVTALASSEMLMKEAIEAGASGYIGKPYSLDELNRAIEGVSPRRRKRRSQREEKLQY